MPPIAASARPAVLQATPRTTSLCRWGSSQAVRILKALCEEMGIEAAPSPCRRAGTRRVST